MLFQIEEPDGSPSDAAEGPGAAIGIDLSGAHGAVAIAVGGNAEALASRDGGPGPATAGWLTADGALAAAPATAGLLALRGMAERALARPVTHAVLVVAAALPPRAAENLIAAGAASGLIVTRILTAAEATALAPSAGAREATLYGAAVAAEDDTLALRQPLDTGNS
jgi:hypothetical protein